ncbi:Copper transport protein CTR2 [Golovinomyces cichoracearum]|uniref:Copper transport protein n=1 Tax=Golovinomyces cichoracearum TaxID=62708 RepID=A0A420H9E1_9PEZI|nr:Copper transport protein CTR2 [Golovinomyces cichoracearum]
MDHSHHMHMNHDHSQMDHSHMDHGDGTHMIQCSMNMLFTWDTSNLCIIFHWWRIRGPISLVFSLLGVIAVTAMFEAVRAASRRYEKWVNQKKKSSQRKRLFNMNRRTHIIKAVIYSIQSFYGLMLMLIFMTYNGWVMMCMGIGAFLGYLIFGHELSATKDGACH